MKYYPDNVKLCEVAENWQKSKGLQVPPPDTEEYKKMFEGWIKHAFGGCT